MVVRMKNKIGTAASRAAAIILLIGGLGVAGCAVFVPADSVTPQVSEGSRTTTTTTTQSNVPDPSTSTTEKTTTIKSNTYY
jgi:hypothetical protein